MGARGAGKGKINDSSPTASSAPNLDACRLSLGGPVAESQAFRLASEVSGSQTTKDGAM